MRMFREKLLDLQKLKMLVITFRITRRSHSFLLLAVFFLVFPWILCTDINRSQDKQQFQMTSLVQYAYPKRWWSPSCESFLNHLRSFGSSCLCVGVGKKSSLTAQNNLILWGKVPPLRPLLMGSWFWWVLAVTDHYAVFACLWITRVWWQRYCMFLYLFFHLGFCLAGNQKSPL